MRYASFAGTKNCGGEKCSAVLTIFLMDSKQLGNFGEKIACQYLEQKGYKILDRNYVKELSAVLKGEIDVIAKKGGIISFIEVKASKDFPGRAFSPEDRVNYPKQRQIIKIAQMWLGEKKIPLDSKWQIDVVAVRIDLATKKAKIRHLENAFC